MVCIRSIAYKRTAVYRQKLVCQCSGSAFNGSLKAHLPRKGASTATGLAIALRTNHALGIELLKDNTQACHEAADLFPNLICLLTAIEGWPLIPDWMTSILLPDLRNRRVCSSIDCDVSTAAGCFLLAGALVGLRAMLYRPL